MTQLSNRPVVLEFDSALDTLKNGKSLRDNLSAVLRVGPHLFLASDETATIERLTTDDGFTFKHHKQFMLSEFIRLPEGDDKEVDIEGLAYSGDYLWVVGSHSLSRPKPKPGSGDLKQEIKRLAKIESDENRYLLARIPLVEREGALELSESCPCPSDPSHTLTAESLLVTNKVNELIEALSDDAHFGPFLSIPGKDNGFDIEGLAVTRERIFIGLRGPVLRGWASIIEMEVKGHTGPLSLKEIGSKGKPYMKHFLQLDGLGIREILIDGVDLLILAGPTMNLDGPVAVYRWREAMRVSGPSLVGRDQLEKLFNVPYGEGEDHAEGITFMSKAGEPTTLLIVYDTPDAGRKIGDSAVRADLFEIG